MRRIGSIAALAAISATVPAQAMPHGATVLPYGSAGQDDIGVGVTVGVKIKLGSDRDAKKSERVKITLDAGPVMTVSDPSARDGFRRSEASLLGLELRPGYSTKLNFAGQPMLVDYTLLGASDKDEDGSDKQSVFDKVAWVALVAGVVAVGVISACLGDTECSGSE